MRLLARILLVLMAFAMALIFGEVFGQNQKPVTKDDLIELGENGIVLLNALDNDSDPDLDVLRISSFTFLNKSYSIAAGASKIIKLWDTGILSVHSNGAVQFYPREQFNGSKELQIGYNATDGHGGTAKATIVIRYYDSFEVFKDSIQYCAGIDSAGTTYHPLVRIRILGKMHYYYFNEWIQKNVEISRKEWLGYYSRKIRCK